MKKGLKIFIIIAVSLIATAVITFVCLQIFGFKGKSIEDLPEQGEEQLIIDNHKTIEECTPKESLYVLAGKMNQISYHAMITGKVTALGGIYKQTIEGEKFFSDGNALYITKSLGVKKVGKKIYIDQENNVKVLDSINLSDDTWNDEAICYTLSEYLKEYGVDFRSITNYLLNDETILESELVKVEDKKYTYKYKLNNETATIGYRINMAKMGDLDTVPEFSKCECTIVMNENFEPISVSCDEKYTMAMFGMALGCEASLLVSFDSLNKTIEFPVIEQFGI